VLKELRKAIGLLENSLIFSGVIKRDLASGKSFLKASIPCLRFLLPDFTSIAMIVLPSS
jgi:hypothetical protein